MAMQKPHSSGSEPPQEAPMPKDPMHSPATPELPQPTDPDAPATAPEVPEPDAPAEEPASDPSDNGTFPV